jgi:copper transporter 1
MYNVLALIFIFVLSILVEWLSYFHLIKPGPKHVWVGLVQTILHALKVGLAFMVMLAVMSFNVGLFLVAVAGHSVGFLLFRSRVFKDLDTGNCPDVPSSSY